MKVRLPALISVSALAIASFVAGGHPTFLGGSDLEQRCGGDIRTCGDGHACTVCRWNGTHCITCTSTSMWYTCNSDAGSGCVDGAVNVNCADANQWQVSMNQQGCTVCTGMPTSLGQCMQASCKK
jgi:hypothetical protein